MRSTNYEKYLTKNPFLSFFVNKFSKNIISIIKRYKVKQILDVGCGEGFIINILKQNIPSLKIEGMDIDKKQLNIAKSSNPETKFIKGDIEKMPYKKKSFEVLIVLEVLEHIKSPKIALTELSRIAKDFCIISVPYEPYFSIANLLRFKNISRLGKDPEHIHFWKKNEIRNLISKQMAIIETKISFPWLIFVCKTDI